VPPGLVVAPERLGHQAGVRPTMAGQPDVAAAPGNAVGRSQPGDEPLSLVGGQSADNERVSPSTALLVTVPMWYSPPSKEDIHGWTCESS